MLPIFSIRGFEIREAEFAMNMLLLSSWFHPVEGISTIHGGKL